MSLCKPQPSKTTPCSKERAGRLGLLLSVVLVLFIGGVGVRRFVRVPDSTPQLKPPQLVSQPPARTGQSSSRILQEPNAQDSRGGVPLNVGTMFGPSAVEKSAQTLMNHTHNLRAHVNERGWEIEPLENRKGARPWRWRYSLKAVKRGKLASRVSEANLRDITQEGDQIKIHRRDLRMDEWYRTTDLGIEQGFTISEPIFRKDSPAVLVLSAHVESDLIATRIQQDSITFSQGKDRTVRYDGLKVVDAKGTVLPSWFSFSKHSRTEGTLDINVDDAHAVYPIVVDPLASSPGWTKSGTVAASAGDVNGDGYADVIVGMGVYYGADSGPSATADWTCPAACASVLASAGDVNNDGYGDIVAGGSGCGSWGQVMVYLGGQVEFLAPLSGRLTESLI